MFLKIRIAIAFIAVGACLCATLKLWIEKSIFGAIVFTTGTIISLLIGIIALQETKQ